MNIANMSWTAYLAPQLSIHGETRCLLCCTPRQSVNPVDEIACRLIELVNLVFGNKVVRLKDENEEIPKLRVSRLNQGFGKLTTIQLIGKGEISNVLDRNPGRFVLNHTDEVRVSIPCSFSDLILRKPKGVSTFRKLVAELGIILCVF